MDSWMTGDQYSYDMDARYAPSWSAEDDTPYGAQVMGYNGASHGRVPESNAYTNYRRVETPPAVVARSYEGQFESEQRGVPTYTGAYRQGSLPMWRGKPLTPTNCPAMEMPKRPVMRDQSVDSRYRDLYRNDPLFPYYGYTDRDFTPCEEEMPYITIKPSDLNLMLFMFIILVIVAIVFGKGMMSIVDMMKDLKRKE